jgi:peptidoglycan/LPS O-acetylase OafA/YrhL
MVVGARISIMTHLRVDEILAGACVALLVAGRINARWKWPMVYVPGWVWAILLFLSANPLSQQLQYFRPYFGALLVGSTLLRNQAGFTPFFVRPTLKYLATISYALYIIHAYFTIGWFGEGNTLTKYLVKRPVGITLTFILAHLSTFHWEAHWIALGKRLTSKSVPKGLPPSLEIKVCPDSPDSRMNSEQPNQSIADSLTCPR